MFGLPRHERIALSPSLVFYKDLLDRLDITPVVYRVQKDGKSYKGAVDSFLSNEISEEAKEEYNKIFDDLYYVFLYMVWHEKIIY